MEESLLDNLHGRERKVERARSEHSEFNLIQINYAHRTSTTSHKYQPTLCACAIRQMHTYAESKALLDRYHQQEPNSENPKSDLDNRDCNDQENPTFQENKMIGSAANSGKSKKIQQERKSDKNDQRRRVPFELTSCIVDVRPASSSFTRKLLKSVASFFCRNCRKLAVTCVGLRSEQRKLTI
jgi:hypothetical protein